MKKWLKKVLSLLIAMALLVSAGALAFADEDAEPIETAAAEEAAAQQAAEEAAAAQKAAEEAAAQQAAEEAAAAQRAAEEAAAAQKAAEEAAAQQAAEQAPAAEADPIPSYNNNEETPAENQQEGSDVEENDEEEAYDPDDPTIISIDDNDYGHTDPVTVEELGLQVTDEMKFPNAVRLGLNETVSGSVDSENPSEYIFTSTYNMAAVLSLSASAEDIFVMINDTPVEFTKAEGTENEAGLNATSEMVLPEGTYHIVLTSSSPVNYTLSIVDPYKVNTQTEETASETAAETPADGNGEEEPAVENTKENKQEGSETEGTGAANSENNKDEGTNENEIPVLTGWISVNAESYEIGDTITLKAESETELGDMVLWQTKVRNDEGEDAWQNLSYGATLDVELTEENINATYRFKMEYDNFSDELTLNAKAEEEIDTEETEETEETEQPEETEETEETETTEETEEAEETEDEKMAALGCTKVIVTAEEGADLYAEANKESEVTGHLDAETEIWVTLNEDQTWGQLYSEDEEVAAQFISMDEAEIVIVEEETKETEETEETEEPEEIEETEDEKMAALGFIRVTVTAEEGADLYAEADRESEVVGHLDAETEIWVTLNEEETWGQLYSEDEEAAAQFICMEDVMTKEAIEEAQMNEKGFYKVQILNENGTDVYDGTGEEATVISHLEYESVIWIKDLEDAEGWAELYTETAEIEATEATEAVPATEEIEETEGTEEAEKTAKTIGSFVKLDEIGRQMPSDEEMLEAGYIKVYVAYNIGANVYASAFETKGEKPVAHLEAGTELWVKLVENADRALIFCLDKEAPDQYINLVDIIVMKKPKGVGDLPTRELKVTSSIDGYEVITAGSKVTFETELVNFLDDDNYVVQWKYSVDGKEFLDIEEANDLEYQFVITMENASYIWKVSVTLIAPAEE